MIGQHLRECIPCLALSRAFEDLKGTPWFNKCLLMNARVVKGKLNINIIKMQLHKLAGFTACTELAFTTALEKKKEKTKIQLTLLPLHYHVFIVQSRI